VTAGRSTSQLQTLVPEEAGLGVAAVTVVAGTADALGLAVRSIVEESVITASFGCDRQEEGSDARQGEVRCTGRRIEAHRTNASPIDQSSNTDTTQSAVPPR
jgi:hypothetical protein